MRMSIWMGRAVPIPARSAQFSPRPCSGRKGMGTWHALPRCAAPAKKPARLISIYPAFSCACGQAKLPASAPRRPRQTRRLFWLSVCAFLPGWLPARGALPWRNAAPACSAAPSPETRGSKCRQSPVGDTARISLDPPGNPSEIVLRASSKGTTTSQQTPPTHPPIRQPREPLSQVRNSLRSSALSSN